MRNRRLAYAVVLLLVASCTRQSTGTTGVETPTTSLTEEVVTTVTTVPTEPDDELPVLDDVAPPEWEPTTRSEELAVKLDESDHLSVQDAVDLFALAYPDFPGSTPTSLPAGDVPSSSYVWMLIESVRDRLAEDQIAFLDDQAGGEVIGTIEAGGGFVEGPPPTGAVGVVFSAFPTGVVGGRRSANFVADGPVAQVDRAQYVRYGELLAIVANELLAFRPDLPRFKVLLTISRFRISGAMDSGPYKQDRSFCQIRVDPRTIAASYGDITLKYFFAHELFHCVQWLWNPAMDYRVAQWLFDGSAHFAAGDLYRSTYDPPREFVWFDWFAQQPRALQGRTYDAWALFESWRQYGGDAYASIKAMVQNPSRSPAAVLATGGMDGLYFRMDWSSRSLRSEILPEQNWHLSWPGVNGGAGPHENISARETRGIGSYPVRGGGRFSHPEVIVRMASPVGLVVAVPSGGPLSTHTADGNVHIAEGAVGRFCFDPGGCRCPDGQTADAYRMVGRDMLFSMPAAASKPTTWVEAVRWDPRKHCKDPGEKKRADSMGDPHLVTFDGLPFDVMTLGEFVTTRDPQGDFEIQTRHVPAAIRPGAAATAAVAIGTGDNRITFTVDDVATATTPVVRVDGDLVTDASLSIGDVAVEVDGLDAKLTWPDGTEVELAYYGGWFVTVFASLDRVGRLEGLLGGGGDGDFTNDLQMPDGSVVDPVDAAKPDSDFSLAWAVDETTTLFDYQQGQSPATFRIPMPPEVDPFELLDEALEMCTNALGADAVSHEIRSCAFDVSVTGNEGYVDAYEEIVDERVAAAETVETAERPSSGGGPAAAGREGEPTLTLSGTLAAGFSSAIGEEGVVGVLSGTMDAEAGTVVVARAERCTPEVTLFLYVTNAANGSSGSLFLCDPFGLQTATAHDDDESIPGEVYFWLPGGGQFDVRVETDAEDPLFQTINVFVDPTPTIIDNRDAVNGHAITLEGIGDTVVYLSASEGVSTSLTAQGLDVACAIEAYGAPPFNDDSVWPLAGFCPHSERVTLPGLDIPLVVFTRTEEPAEIELVP
jgi:hypothetical protein